MVREEAGQAKEMGVDGPPHLGGELVDDLATVVMNLAREVWVQRDRNAVLEGILVDKGILSPDEVDRFVPAGAADVALERERERFVKELFRTSSLEV